MRRSIEARATPLVRARSFPFLRLATRLLFAVVLTGLFHECLAGDLTLAWDPVVDSRLGGYELNYGRAPGSYDTQIDVGDATTTTVSGLEAGNTYYFAVRAYSADLSLWSDFSNEISWTFAAVPEPAPVAAFSATPTTGTAPLTVAFQDLSTGTIDTWYWDFGDGATSSTRFPSHVYAAAGTYSVSLTVTGPGGTSTDVKPGYITVSTATTDAPTADFTATNTSGVAPLTVAFEDLSSDSVTTWRWEFGDGSSSNVQNPVHTYEQPGIYDVTLTVTDATGLSDSLTQDGFVSVQTADTEPLLVAAYGFEETSDLWVIDASGNQNDGIIDGATRIDTGRYGRALAFDGINDWVTVADSALLDLSTGMTLEGWLYPTESMTAWSCVLTKERLDGLSYSLCANSGDDQPSITVHTDTDRTVTGGPWLQPGLWTHLASTYDGATLRLFFNGTEVGSQPVSGSIAASDDPLRIGGNSVWLDDFFRGYIDEVRIYNRALSATEIQADMATAVVEGSAVIPAPTAAFAADVTSGEAPLTVSFTDYSTGTIDNWLWEFGDGSTSSLQHPTHSYDLAGSYTVSLTVTGPGGSASETKLDYIVATEPAPVAPTASFTATNTSGVAPLTVFFQDLSSDSVTAWHWDFGDGGSSEVQNPLHTYSQAGIYDVTLTVTDAGGLSDSITEIGLVAVSAGDTGSTPVAAYGFEETADLWVIDASGNQNDGIIDGATRIDAGRFGRALAFDGIDDWVTVSDAPTLDLASGMTLEAWLYPTESMTTWRCVLVKERLDGLSYSLCANSGENQPSTAVHIDWDHNVSGGPWLPPGQWSHVASTYDGATLRLFVNGIEVGSAPVSGTITASDRPLRMGGNDVWLEEFFRGYIDEVRVYDHALTATEIQADMATPVVQETSVTPPPTAAFAANVTSGQVPLAVSFTDYSTGTIDSWAWEFGDGATSALQHPTHTYESAGSYTVSLTVTGPGGSATETKVDYIAVTAPDRTWPRQR